MAIPIWCGHSLLGTAGLGVALALQHTIVVKEFPGTIRYYGCPGEESLAGKVFMARTGHGVNVSQRFGRR